jgi:hypothetical protein
VKEFARDVRAIVRDDPVVFVNTGYNTLELFLHRYQASMLPATEAMAGAKWIVAPLLPGIPPQIVSKKLPTAPISRSVILGLYPADRVRDRIEK